MRTIVALVLALLVSPAFAEPFTSTEYGFSADFPGAPTQTPPQDSGRDSSGKVIAVAVAFSAGETHKHATVVTAEKYLAETTLDARPYMEASRDGFMVGMGSLTSSRTGTFGDHPALWFTFSGPNYYGRGVVIVVQTPIPRAYVVVIAGAPGKTTPADDAVMERFMESFRIIG